ncbi:MAG TPA: MaoC/PaaZ C-terminal domain-containing protein [bacterium]|nr:MaoC/PaaZ C-terminal domain-containing protein [bacterium]
MSMYYEDVEVGAEFESPGRTVTEADVVGFAALSGDWNAIHTDAVFASGTRFGQRIAHGVFGIALATGLSTRLGLFGETTVALLSVEWKFRAPVFIGDTLRLRVRVVSKRLTSRGDTGVLERQMALVNQRGEVVQEGTMPILVRVRAPRAAAPEAGR